MMRGPEPDTTFVTVDIVCGCIADQRKVLLVPHHLRPWRDVCGDVVD